MAATVGEGMDDPRTYADPVDFGIVNHSHVRVPSTPGESSRTGFEMWWQEDRTWFESSDGAISPVAITLETKAALKCDTGHWPTNGRMWSLLPRWQRAITKPR